MKIYYKFIMLKNNILFADIRSVINNNASRGNHIRTGIIKHLFYDIYFIIVYLVIKQINNDQNAELGWILALMVCTTVLLRQEASIVLCYFIIMLSTFKNCKKILLHNFMLPCVCVQTSYIIKICMLEK